MTRREMTDDQADDHRKTYGRKESDRRMGWPYPPRPEPKPAEKAQ